MKPLKGLFHRGLLMAVVFAIVCIGFASQSSAQSRDNVKIKLANGIVLSAKSATAEMDSLRVEMENGGTIWLQKTELSAEARHIYFGEPLPATPEPEPAKPEKPVVPQQKTAEVPKVEETVPSEPLLTWKKSDLSSAAESFKEEVPKSIEEIPLWVKWYLLRKLGEDVAVYSIRDSGRDAWWCFTEYMEVTSKHADDPKRLKTELYRRTAQHLMVSEHLLAQTDIQLRQRGVAMLVHAATCASLQLKDPLLATAIAEMILSNIELAEAKPGFWFSRDGVIDAAIMAFETAKDWERMKKGFLLLAQFGTKPSSKDTAYDGLARVSLNLGNKDEALEWASKIDPNGRMASMRQRWLKILEEGTDTPRQVAPRQRNPVIRR